MVLLYFFLSAPFYFLCVSECMSPVLSLAFFFLVCLSVCLSVSLLFPLWGTWERLECSLRFLRYNTPIPPQKTLKMRVLFLADFFIVHHFKQKLPVMDCTVEKLFERHGFVEDTPFRVEYFGPEYWHGCPPLSQEPRTYTLTQMCMWDVENGLFLIVSETCTRMSFAQSQEKPDTPFCRPLAERRFHSSHQWEPNGTPETCLRLLEPRFTWHWLCDKKKDPIFPERGEV